MVVRREPALTAERLHVSARELLSSFKVPTLWLLLESDDDVPRGGTGKVDIQRLRERLIEANRLTGPASRVDSSATRRPSPKS